MSYTQHEWTTGETITAAKLNNIEEGIEEAAQSGGGGSLIVHYDNTTGEMDKTVQEIYDAMTSGTPVFLEYIYGTIGTDYSASYSLAPISFIYTYAISDFIRVVVNQPARANDSGGYIYLFKPSVWIFSAGSMNDYPVTYKTVSPSSVQ